MILTKDQIKEIILTNPNRDLITKGIEYNKELRKHLYGVGMLECKELAKIDRLETQHLSELKVKYARSNKDLFKRLARPIDKVFSARGGSIYYNLPDDKQARQLSQNVKSNYSTRKWVEAFWTPHFLDDPFGMIFMEMLPYQEAMLARQEGRSMCYPTYKSITSIYDYVTDGSKVEYVVFNVSTEEKKHAGIDTNKIIYRVVDDSRDYYVERVQQDIVILEGHSFPNYFGSRFAMLTSDIVSPENECCRLSPFDEVIELANHFLMTGAVKLTHEFMHAYPKYWQYAEACGDCAGTGWKVIDGTEGKCKSCNGSGKKIHLSVSDAILLDTPQSANDPIIAPNLAGYISPDKVYYEISTHNMQHIEEIMFKTVWGAQPKGLAGGPQNINNNEKTATEVLSDSKPESDRLQVFSEGAEKIHKFILDNVIRINITPFYEGSSVNYGRRYMIEGPDEIWKKYSDARVAGAPVSVLEDLLIEYYEAKYASDPMALEVCKKLMYVEPFAHHTVEQVKGFMPSEEDWKAKLYFSEWLAIQKETTILLKSVDTLKQSLVEFATKKQLQQPPEQKKLAA